LRITEALMLVQSADQGVMTFVLDGPREWASSLFHCVD